MAKLTLLDVDRARRELHAAGQALQDAKDGSAELEARQEVLTCQRELARCMVKCLIDQAARVGSARDVARQILNLMAATTAEAPLDVALLQEISRVGVGKVVKALAHTLPTQRPQVRGCVAVYVTEDGLYRLTIEGDRSRVEHCG